MALIYLSMTSDPTSSASQPARPAVAPAAGDNQHALGDPAADIWALLDELAARGRALRLQAEGETPAAGPEPDRREDDNLTMPPSPLK